MMLRSRVEVDLPALPSFAAQAPVFDMQSIMSTLPEASLLAHQPIDQCTIVQALRHAYAAEGSSPPYMLPAVIPYSKDASPQSWHVSACRMCHRSCARAARRPRRQLPARRGPSAAPPRWRAPRRRSACRRSCPSLRLPDQPPSSRPGQLCQKVILAEPGRCPLCMCFISPQCHSAPSHLSLWTRHLRLGTAGGPA